MSRDNNDINKLLYKNFGFLDDDYSDEDAIPLGRLGMIEQVEKYYALLKGTEQQLYPNCKTLTKVLCLIRLFQFKVRNS